MYYRARWHDPALGKFLNDDPMGFGAGDANVSRYVGNSASLRIDSSGLDWHPPIELPNVIIGPPRVDIQITITLPGFDPIILGPITIADPPPPVLPVQPGAIRVLRVGMV